jgi:glycosyltransferase involved in cell wall biosynthesis
VNFQDPYYFLNPKKLLSKEEKEWLKKANIIHLAPPWLEIQADKRTYGGTENVIDNNIRSLSEFGVGSQVLYAHPKSKVLERRLNNTLVRYPSDEEYKKADLKMLLQFPTKALRLEDRFLLYAYEQSLMKSDSISVVHDHTDTGRAIADFYCVNFPVVRTEHNLMLYPGEPTGKKEELHNKLIRALYKKTYFPPNHFYIAISESQRSQMQSLPWIGVVHNGVNLSDFDMVTEKKGNPALGGMYLLALGQITQKKGIHSAIKIAKALDMPLVIAGQVENFPGAKKYYREMIKPHLSKQIIHFNKGVDVKTRRKLMRDASAFLMMIEWEEPFGLVAAEANASGTPVIAYRRGAVPEVIEDGKTGFIVDNLEEAIEATKKVLDGAIDSAYCRKRVELNFSGDVMSAKLVKVYREAELRFLGKSRRTGLMRFKFPKQLP